MSPYILPVCGCPEARPRGVTANVEDIRGHILRVSVVYLIYTTVMHAPGAVKCTITELGVYASIYTPSYQPIRLICNDVMWYIIVTSAWLEIIMTLSSCLVAIINLSLVSYRSSRLV